MPYLGTSSTRLGDALRTEGASLESLDTGRRVNIWPLQYNLSHLLVYLVIHSMVPRRVDVVAVDVILNPGRRCRRRYVLFPPESPGVTRKVEVERSSPAHLQTCRQSCWAWNWLYFCLKVNWTTLFSLSTVSLTQVNLIEWVEGVGVLRTPYLQGWECSSP